MSESLDLTRALAHFAAQTPFEALPDAVVHETRRLTLDTIGCALGAIHTDSGRLALEYARITGGESMATVLGGPSSAATTAAYVNARLANVLDADDTFPTATHFGNAGIFSALAVSEQFDRSGRDFLRSAALGFDIAARIGSWMGAPIQVENGKIVGFNALAGPAAAVTWAAVGSAAAARELTTDQVCHAFGIAGANSPLPSMHKFIEQTDISMYKYADAGWCAQIGVSAALLAGLGSTGMARILDGPHGFWRLFGSPGHDDHALVDGLGLDWQILNTTYKAWPCCRFIHYPLTAFSRLKAEHDLRPEEMERIVVRSSPFAMSHIFLDQQPANPLSAEFSHAHALAAAAFDVPAGPLWLDMEALAAEPMRRFRDRVEIVTEPSCANMADYLEGGQWRRIPGGVDIHARGQIFSATCDMARGDPWSAETLMSDDDLRAKFRVMIGVERLGGADARAVDALADEVIAAIDGLAETDIGVLTRPLAALATAVRPQRLLADAA